LTFPGENVDKGVLAERKLRRNIEAVIESMDVVFGADLSEEEALQRKISNAQLSIELAEQIVNIIKCRKISERAMDLQLIDKKYRMVVDISTRPISYALSRI
jgi:hypothetical protein